MLATNLCQRAEAVDPLILAGATLGLGVVALVATLIPARRATRVNPVTALRG